MPLISCLLQSAVEGTGCTGKDWIKKVWFVYSKMIKRRSFFFYFFCLLNIEPKGVSILLTVTTWWTPLNSWPGVLAVSRGHDLAMNRSRELTARPWIGPWRPQARGDLELWPLVATSFPLLPSFHFLSLPFLWWFFSASDSFPFTIHASGTTNNHEQFPFLTWMNKLH